jgi:hypothetical protein
MVNPDRNLYEPPYDDALLYDSDLEPERPRSRPLVVLLGIVVLAAFAGVVWVAYNQGVKQGQRGAPVLTADAGPTRIVPDQTATSTINPAPDKSYERLWGDTQEREGSENVLPQPEQPRTVPAPQDVASANALKPEGSVGGPLESKATDVLPPTEDPRMDSTVGSVSSLAETGSPRPITSTPPSSNGSPAVFGPRPQEDISSALPPAESVTPPVTTPRPLPPTATAKTTSPKPAAPSITNAKPATPPAASISEKSAIAGPKVLSAETTPAAPPAAVEKPTTALVPETTPAPASAPPASGGSVMIQLGSFPNDGLAASAWSKIKSSNQELLGSYSPSIKPAEIPGKGTWYRLRVGGFADKASAKSVCDQLASSGQACIVAGK